MKIMVFMDKLFYASDLCYTMKHVCAQSHSTLLPDPMECSHFLLQGIFLTQVSNSHLLCLLHWQTDSLPAEPPGSSYSMKSLEWLSMFTLQWIQKTFSYNLFACFPWQSPWAHTQMEINTMLPLLNNSLRKKIVAEIKRLPLQLSWLRIRLQCWRPGFNPWVKKIPWRGKGYPFQYSGLENTMDFIVHGVTKSQIQLSDFHFYFTS